MEERDSACIPVLSKGHFKVWCVRTRVRADMLKVLTVRVLINEHVMLACKHETSQCNRMTSESKTEC